MPDDPADLLALMPFAATIGIALDCAEPDEVSGRLAWSPERCTAGGLLHGGALMTLADSVGAVFARQVSAVERGVSARIR